MFPATATGLVIHRDLSSSQGEGRRRGWRGGKQQRWLCSVPALSSTLRAVGCQATMPTLLEWPSSTTTGSVRDRVSPFSGICHTCKGKESAQPRAAPLKSTWLSCFPRPTAAGAVTSLCKQHGNWGGNRSQLSINPWLIHEEHPSSVVCQHNPQLLMVQPLYFHVHGPALLLFPRECEQSPLQLQFHGNRLLSFQTVPVPQRDDVAALPLPAFHFFRNTSNSFSH